MSNNTLSIIIPAYNEEKYLPRLFESIQKAKQYLKDRKPYDIELILVDNDSSDRTADIARQYGAIIIHEKKRLIARVRNTGAQAASGDIFCFIDADNEISENAFYLVTEYIESGQYPCGGFKIIPDQDGILTKILFWIFIEVIFIFHGTSGGLIFCTRDYYHRVGGFDEQYYASEDAWFVRSLKKLAKSENRQFANIIDGYVRTSTRKFHGKNAIQCILFILKVMFIPGALRKYSTTAKVYYEVRQK